MTEHDVEQRSEEWFSLRLGRVTSSRVSDALSVRRDGKPTTGRANLRTALVLERITAHSQESDYANDHMRRGIELEAEALDKLEATLGMIISPVGFLVHDDLEAGASPDGRVDDGRIVEVKCQIPALHLGVLRSGQPPRQFLPQLRHEQWIAESPSVIYVSYCPQFPEPLNLSVLGVTCGRQEIQQHADAVAEFLHEVDLEENDVRQMMKRLEDAA